MIYVEDMRVKKQLFLHCNVELVSVGILKRKKCSHTWMHFQTACFTYLANTCSDNKFWLELCDTNLIKHDRAPNTPQFWRVLKKEFVFVDYWSPSFADLRALLWTLSYNWRKVVCGSFNTDHHNQLVNVKTGSTI